MYVHEPIAFIAQGGKLHPSCLRPPAHTQNITSHYEPVTLKTLELPQCHPPKQDGG
jgi:hypothetical protein